jgi:hypothetical protein
VTSLIVKKQTIGFYQHWRSPSYYTFGKRLFRRFNVIDINNLGIPKVNVTESAVGDVFNLEMVTNWINKNWKQL